MNGPTQRPTSKQLKKLQVLFNSFGKNWFRGKQVTFDIAQSVGLSGKTPEASLIRDLTQGLKPFLDHENQKYRLSQVTIELLARHGYTTPTPKPRLGTVGAATNTVICTTSAFASAAHAGLAPPASTLQLYKFELMVLNAQFGKTFENNKDLSKSFALDLAENKSSLTIICTQNALLSNAQFTSRVTQVEELQQLEKQHGVGVVCVIASKTKTSLPTFKDVGALITKCWLNPSFRPRVIVVCSNRKRFDEIEPIVQQWKNVRWTHSIHLVFDEIHAYINQIREIIERFHEEEFDIVKTTRGLTATPACVFRGDITDPWHSLRLRFLDEYNNENYYYSKDMMFIEHPPVDDVASYDLPEYVRDTRYVKNVDGGSISVFRFVVSVLAKHPDILECEGSKRAPRVLIPGHRNTVSHYMIRELVWHYNPEALVVIINGHDKAVFVNRKTADDEYVKYSLAVGDDEFPEDLKDKEMCEVLAYQLKKHDLLNRAIVYTGNVCIGMGQTLSHYEYGNMSDQIQAPEAYKSSDDRYQASGRSNGRCKHWDTFTETRIHTTRAVYDTILKMEERSTNTGRYSESGKTITFNDYKNATDTSSSDTQDNLRCGKPSVRNAPRHVASPSSYRVYRTFSQLCDAVAKMGWRTPVLKEADVNGFHKTSLNGPLAVASLAQAIAKVPSGWGGSAPGTAKAMRTYYPCYVDTRDNSTLRFVLLIRPKENGTPYSVEELKQRLGPLYEEGELDHTN